MPSFDGNQKGQILIKISEFIELSEAIDLQCFQYSIDIDRMYYWDIGNSVSNRSKPPVELAAFKPENRQLNSDISFWQIFLNFDIKNRFNVATTIDIPQNIYQNFLSGLNQLIGWCEMVKRAYLTEDILCYQNIQTINVDSNGNPVTSETNSFDILLGGTQEQILPATPNITPNSRPAKVWTILQGKSQVYFDVSTFQSDIDTLASIVTEILGILNNPTPETTQSITPVQIDSTGTRKLLQAILDFQTSVTITFQKVLEISRNIYGHVSFVLLFLREDTKKDLNTIIENTQLIIGGNPDSIGVTSLNQIRYVWLTGSDGNYYPIPPVESSSPDNDVPLSRNNGILAGLKRADENARWRYQRINDVLYEINTNNNINKAYLDDLSPRIIEMQVKINQLETKIINIETKLNLMDLKLDQIITKVNTL